MASTGEQVLSLRGLEVSYGGVRAVRGVSLDVAAGEVVGIVGESGSGKTTLLRAVAGLLPDPGRMSGGQALFAGKDLQSLSVRERALLRRGGMAYVFQNPTQSLDPLFRIQTQFDECLRAHGTRSRAQLDAIEHALLEEMGLGDGQRVLRSFPHELSGGMCQRVVLAMALACGPRLLLADEPTSALDVVSQRQVARLLRGLRDDHGVAIIVVSHNIGALSLVSDRLAVMCRGELVEVGDCERVLVHPEHPYTRSLIQAMPRVDGSLPGVADYEMRA